MPSATMGQVILGRKGRRVVVDTGSILTALGWNVLDASPEITLSNGDRTATKTVNALGNGLARSVTSRTNTGQWKSEFTAPTVASSRPVIGLASAALPLTGVTCDLDKVGTVGYYPNGGLYSDGVQVATIDTWTSGSTVSMEEDRTTGQVWFEKAGGTGRKGPYTIPSGADYAATVMAGTGVSCVANFGQAAFAVTPTSGFVARG